MSLKCSSNAADLMFALTEVGVAVSWRMDKLLSSRCWAQDTEEEEP